MKKLIYPVIILLIALLIFINYYAYKSPKINKIITQSKLYTILNEQNLLVNFYTNHQSPYLEYSAVESVYLEDNQNNRWLINLLNISKENSYDYLKEKFDNYLLTFSLPKLTTNVSMEEAYIKINLKNGDSKTFLIGSLNYYYQEETNLIINEYYATKKEHSLEVETISLKLELKEPIKIVNIFVGNYQHYYDYYVDSNETILIAIPPLFKIVDSFSLKIIYEINDIEHIEILPFFIFFENYENPLSYGSLNNVYVIS